MFERSPRGWMIVLLAFALWGGEHLRRGLWEPDEARYAYVAREMHEDGRWFVPHLHGEPYPDKPPLPFWLINAAAALNAGRITGTTARMPTFIASVLVLWVTARLLERWAGPDAAWRGVGVLLTTYLFWHEGGWGRLDLLVLAFEMLALYHLFRYDDTSHPGRLVAAYACIGLGLLTKGPVAWAVPVGIYVASSVATGQAHRLRRWHWLWGTALAASLPGCWLAAAWWQGAGPEYFLALFGEKSFGRVLQDHHGQPVYYYLTTVPLDLLPWTLFLPPAALAVGPGELRRRLLAWIGCILALFSLFAGKRGVYVLPLFPAAAMLIAAGWSELASRSSPWPRRLGWAAVGFLLLLAVTEGTLAVLPALPIPRWPLVATAVWCGGAGLVLAHRTRLGGMRASWLVTWTSALFVHAALVGAFVWPEFNACKAPVAVAVRAGELLPPGAAVHLYREQLAIVPLYAERPGRRLPDPAAWTQLRETGKAALVVLTESDWNALDPTARADLEWHSFRMGSKHLGWVEFPAQRTQFATAVPPRAH